MNASLLQKIVGSFNGRPSFFGFSVFCFLPVFFPPSLVILGGFLFLRHFFVISFLDHWMMNILFQRRVMLRLSGE